VADCLLRRTADRYQDSSLEVWRAAFDTRRGPLHPWFGPKGRNERTANVSPKPCSAWSKMVRPCSGWPFHWGCSNHAWEARQFPAPFVFLPATLEFATQQHEHRLIPMRIRKIGLQFPRLIIQGCGISPFPSVCAAVPRLQYASAQSGLSCNARR